MTMNEGTKTESLLDGDFSCETTEDLYEPSDDELLYPSRHYTWAHTCVQSQDKKEKIKREMMRQD